MTPELRAILALFVPLAGVVLILLCRKWPNLREAMTIVSAASLFGLVLSLLPSVLDGGEQVHVVLARPVPAVSIDLRLEPLGMTFALLGSFLWIVTAIYAIGYMRGHGEINQTRFFSFFAIAFTGVIGVAFAGNLLTLFIFYEVLTLSTYPLVTHAGTDEARRAGRVYLGILLTTSIGLLLFAVIWTWQIAGTLDFVPGGILEGKAAPDGECGINTSGGLIAKGHPVGATGVAMIGWSAWQLLGKVPAELQVANPKMAATFNIGGPICASVCTVLRRAD